MVCVGRQAVLSMQNVCFDVTWSICPEPMGSIASSHGIALDEHFDHLANHSFAAARFYALHMPEIRVSIHRTSLFMRLLMLRSNGLFLSHSTLLFVFCEQCFVKNAG